MCPDCQGQGRRHRRLRKKVRVQYQQALAAYQQSGSVGEAPIAPVPQTEQCPECQGRGLVGSAEVMPVNPEYPHVAIIGAGIGGVALAVACRQRGIPFTLYERDQSFDQRSQGYGLTLQQASKAMAELGITKLADGVVSTRHMVHTAEGALVGEWGMRKWVTGEVTNAPKRSNIHIARQSLRAELMEQLGGVDQVQWQHQLREIERMGEAGLRLNFEAAGTTQQAYADLVVGADGLRSAVRQQLIGESQTPLHYLGCIVILGICSLDKLSHLQSDLLDGATVFQTANGNERIYIMPYKADSVMWQLSFFMNEADAQALSAKGPQALKQEACRRTQWHTPIPEILAATDEYLISGYPVYDRAILSPEQLAHAPNITLIGDAAHPMSPFKGQGANQALLDALALARAITHGCWSRTAWQEQGLQQAALADFETQMLERSAVKVRGSAAAAEFLHSDMVLQKVDEPRGRRIVTVGSDTL